MIRTIIPLLCAAIFLLAPTTYAQKHDHTWISICPGCDSVGFPIDPPYPAVRLDFSQSLPLTAFNNLSYKSGDVALVMSDSIGTPLFFTNGYKVYHLNGTLLGNGKGLNPHCNLIANPFGIINPSFMMALPIGQEKGAYYLVHLDELSFFIGNKNLLYTKIINLNDSLSGKVLYKNKELLHERDMGMINATKHANGRDWWVTLPEKAADSSKVTNHLFLATKDSIYWVRDQIQENFIPVKEYDWWSNIFSPDGRFYITADFSSGASGSPAGILVRNFDRCNGELYNPVFLPLPNFPNIWVGGASISPNSRFLYVMASEHVFQYDLYADDIAASLDTVVISDGFWSPIAWGNITVPTGFGLCQMGPDGNIYILNLGALYASYIAKPNKKGKACMVVQHGLRLPSPFDGIPYYPNYRLGPLDGSTCDTLGLDNHPLADFWWFSDSLRSVEFSDNSTYEPATWHWDFGDGATSQDTSPIHAYAQEGTYMVCLTVCNAYACDTICKAVPVIGPAATGTVGWGSHYFDVYPNPAQQALHLGTDLPGTCQVELLDLLGRSLRRVAFAGDTAIDLGGVPPGLYVLRFEQGGRALGVRRVVVL